MDEFAVFPMYIFISLGNKVAIVVPYDNNPFLISADTNKDDFEWPWMPNSSKSESSGSGWHAWHTYVVAFAWLNEYGP